MKLILLLSILYSCTGINLRTSPLKISPNTNPDSQYSEIFSVISKGGFFFHRDSSFIYTGSSKLTNMGRACSYSIGYLVAFGDSKIDSARVRGGISDIGLIELETFAILGSAYHRHCTIVRGSF